MHIMYKKFEKIENIKGLSSKKVNQRIQKEGYNEIESAKKRNIFNIFFDVMHEPMFLLLIAGGVIYLMIGSVKEALVLLAFVFVIIGITFYQERKTERALEALRDLSSPRALVIRDGKRIRIAGREVVRGDIIILTEGDRVPADAIILSCSNLSVDESLLTGESVSVRKEVSTKNAKISSPGGDGLSFVYSGTLVVQGYGLAEVQKIGMDTEFGKIGRKLTKIKPEQALLQKETRKIVKRFTILGLALSVLVVIVYGLTKGIWLNAILAGIALSMSILPEEIPVILTVFLALGAWRISKKQILTRRVPIIETLGAATVLCVDKTGTITLNKMTVSEVLAKKSFYNIDSNNLPERFHKLAEFAVLASQKDPFDPVEKAIKEFGRKTISKTKHIHDNWQLVREYPLSKKLFALSYIWKSPDGKDYIIAAKGSPEAIADLCHFGEKPKKELLKNINKMAKDGLRVLGVAKAYFKKPDLPGKQHDFDFEYLGLIGLADPVRPSVQNSLKECYEAGIRTIMITGDYPGTAKNIAEQIGLRELGKVITGQELKNMAKDELKEKIKYTNIFARVVPEQKLLIVEALKENGEIVAMTGDGVNDAPALKAAHIGIAMGERGTDVAREASSLVLLNDDFNSIVKAVKMGRLIFDNLKKAMSYVLAVHVPIAGLAIIPVFMGWPLILLPVNIAFLELIIDPTCSIAFEAERGEPNLMQKPPRNLKEPLFGKRNIILSFMQGLSVLFIVLLVFLIARGQGLNEGSYRALAFTTLVIANLGLILTNRSWQRTIFSTLRSSNKALWWILAGTIAFILIVLYVPFLQNLFYFETLHFIDLAICFSAGIFSIFWFEVLKLTNQFNKKT